MSQNLHLKIQRE